MDDPANGRGQATFIFASFRGFCSLTNGVGVGCVNICKTLSNPRAGTHPHFINRPAMGVVAEIAMFQQLSRSRLCSMMTRFRYSVRTETGHMRSRLFRVAALVGVAV